jgi:hypothetical protein
LVEQFQPVYQTQVPFLLQCHFGAPHPPKVTLPDFAQYYLHRPVCPSRRHSGPSPGSSRHRRRALERAGFPTRASSWPREATWIAERAARPVAAQKDHC